MTVWITQCLCPDRHCIMATAEEAADEAEAVAKVEMPLRQALRDFLAAGEMNPWCGLCGAKQETWRYETRRTRVCDAARGHAAPAGSRSREYRRAAGVRGPAQGAPELRPPGYWMHETSGVLRPAVEAFLAGGPLSAAQIATMRAYLRQWIMAPVWNTNPFATPAGRGDLAELRATVGDLNSREAIARWLAYASDEGIDPL